MVGVQHHAPAALPPGKTRYPLYRRLGGPQGRSGRVRKISPPTGIRSPDRLARSESLYRLSYPGPLQIHKGVSKQIQSSPLCENKFHSFQNKNSCRHQAVSGCVCPSYKDFHQTWYERVTLSAANPTQRR